MALTLGDDQKVAYSVGGTDDAGNPAAIDATKLTWSVSDANVLTVTPATDGTPTAEVVANGPLGSAQVTVTDGTLTAIDDITVVATEATAFNLSAGTPAHK